MEILLRIVIGQKELVLLISNGSANFVNSGGLGLWQNVGTQSGIVKVTFDVTIYTSGTLNVYSGGNQTVGTVNVSAKCFRHIYSLCR